MSTVGEQLRAAREAQKLDIYKIAEATKIRTDYLRALEAGDYDRFNAPVYIRGFVRTYATLLKLDLNQVMSTLDGELGRTEKFSEPPALLPSKRGPVDFVMLKLSLLDWRKTGLVLAGVAVVALVVGLVSAWRHYQKRDPLAGVKPARYQATQAVSGDSLPLPAPAPRRP